MMSEKKYTFDDWVNEDVPSYDEHIPQVEGIVSAGKTGFYPDVLKTEDRIADDEFQKIKKAQKEAYDHVVGYHINECLAGLKEAYENAPIKKLFLNNRKNIIAEELQKADEKILTDVYAGKWSPYRIDSFSYREIMKRKKEGKTPNKLMGPRPDIYEIVGHVSKQSDLPHFEIDLIDEHFRLTILFSEYVEIQRLLDELDGCTGNNRPRYSSENAQQVELNTSANTKLSNMAIYKRYHQLFDDGRGFRQKEAYLQIEDWLLNDLGLTKEEVKVKFNITMDFDSFTRGARNNRYK